MMSGRYSIPDVAILIVLSVNDCYRLNSMDRQNSACLAVYSPMSLMIIGLENQCFNLEHMLVVEIDDQKLS